MILYLRFNIIWHCAENLTYLDFHKAMN
ncbi:hypothetical protein [uncultured Nostoc sp.]